MTDTFLRMAAAIALGIAATIPARSETLRVVTWVDYLPPVVAQAWERESGTRLDVVTFDNHAESVELIENGRAGPFDVAFIGANRVKPLVDSWKLVEVSERTVPTVRHIGERFRDECGGFGLPFSWETLGIVYRKGLDPAPTSWADILRPAPELRGRISMMRGHDELLAPALLMLGKRLDTRSRDDVAEAATILRKQAPAVATHNYVFTVLDDPARVARIDVALGFSGDQIMLGKLAGGEWRYTVPEEGTYLWTDCAVAMAASPKRDLALWFIELLGRPEIAAASAEYLHLASPNKDATRLLPATLRGDPAVYPTAATMRRVVPIPQLSDSQRWDRRRAVEAIVGSDPGTGH